MIAVGNYLNNNNKRVCGGNRNYAGRKQIYNPDELVFVCEENNFRETLASEVKENIFIRNFQFYETCFVNLKLLLIFNYMHY